MVLPSIGEGMNSPWYSGRACSAVCAHHRTGKTRAESDRESESDSGIGRSVGRECRFVTGSVRFGSVQFDLVRFGSVRSGRVELPLYQDGRQGLCVLQGRRAVAGRRPGWSANSDREDNIYTRPFRSAPCEIPGGASFRRQSMNIKDNNNWGCCLAAVKGFSRRNSCSTYTTQQRRGASNAHETGPAAIPYAGLCTMRSPFQPNGAISWKRFICA